MEKLIIKGFFGVMILFAIFMANLGGYISTEHLGRESVSLYQDEIYQDYEEGQALGIQQKVENEYFTDYQIKRTINYSLFLPPTVKRDTLVKIHKYRQKS